MHFKVSNQYLCEILWENVSPNPKIDKVDLIIKKIRSENNFSENQLVVIAKNLKTNFISHYDVKWKKASRQRNYFQQKFSNFLSNNFVVELPDILDTNLLKRNDNLTNNSKGRPRKSFEEGSEKTKTRIATEIAEMYSIEELRKALEIKEKLVNTDKIPNDRKVDKVEKKNNDESLAMYVDIHLSKRRYEKLTYHIKKEKLPPYLDIAQAKNNCYPEYKDHIEATESGARVDLISLLGHTVKRILLTLDIDLSELKTTNLELLGKWGMDGASGQQMTRQKWSKQKATCDKENEESSFTDEEVLEELSTEKNNYNQSDHSVFLISFVPLLLKSGNVTIWTNQTPSSVHWCRPIEFEFTKENKDIVLEKYHFYSKLLNKVKFYSIQVKGIDFEVSFDLKCTMVDGKICNFLTGQKASNCCNICGVGPKKANNIGYIRKLTTQKKFYQFGLSTLHCWIRFMEYLLHIAYNLDFKRAWAKTVDEKQKKLARKKIIQESLKKDVSILVDVVRQGSGTSNTGNVAREFFSNAEAVAKATGLNAKLIRRMHTILQVITCSRKTISTDFGKYCLITAAICIKLYPWYPIPPSVHKVLFHGKDIIDSFYCPIGWFSEEAQESNNKVFREARAKNSRMTDRKSTNFDTFSQLLIESDPVIAGLRVKEYKKKRDLTEDAEKLVLPKYS